MVTPCYIEYYGAARREGGALLIALYLIALEDWAGGVHVCDWA